MLFDKKMENLEQIKPEDIRQKIADYRNIINVFSELLQTENQALKAYDTDTVGKLFEKKAHIVSVYRTLVAFFIKNKETLNILSSEERASLKAQAASLDNLLKENDQLLKTRMETSQTVMNSIIKIAKAANNANATSYGRLGTYSPQDNSKNAIAVNRTL